ncbi:MAG: hypothetical protein H5U24_00980 [Thioclava marina]|uniref:hypothetical protein n=1 Tax=Thioclava marina TaxID=1915077 RepID=UPI0019A2C0AC|nr:hypothetical protein [Thioclava marina]MBC7143959.1 hypothetical protein [Thioclava marina]
MTNVSVGLTLCYATGRVIGTGEPHEGRADIAGAIVSSVGTTALTFVTALHVSHLARPI